MKVNTESNDNCIQIDLHNIDIDILTMLLSEYFFAVSMFNGHPLSSCFHIFLLLSPFFLSLHSKKSHS